MPPNKLVAEGGGAADVEAEAVVPNKLAKRGGGSAAVEAGAVVPPNELATRAGGAAAVEAGAVVVPNKLAERGGGAAGVEAEAVPPNKLAERGGGADAAAATPSRCLLPTVSLWLLEVALAAMIESCRQLQEQLHTCAPVTGHLTHCLPDVVALVVVAVHTQYIHRERHFGCKLYAYMYMYVHTNSKMRSLLSQLFWSTHPLCTKTHPFKLHYVSTPSSPSPHPSPPLAAPSPAPEADAAATERSPAA